MPDARRQPGLHLHTSNRLESLVAALAEVTRAPLSSPFRKETIVVQSQGMARWIKQRLADRHGVCANIAFPFPNEMASELFLALFPELPARPPFDRDVMLWLVMKHLPALLDKPGFEDPRRYLDDGADLRKLHQLARKVAYLFDQYFIFRPGLVRAWDRGEDAQWQAELWRRIRPEIFHRHPAELHEQFARLLQGPGFVADKLPERLCVFGISALPPFHLDLFTALGARLPVHLFVVQPSREYWGDIVSGREEELLLKRARRAPAASAELHLERGNRLLASLGPLGRDFLKLVYSTGEWQEHDDFTEPEGGTLLASIQSDILNLRDRGRGESQGSDQMIEPPSPQPSPPGRGGAKNMPGSKEHIAASPALLCADGDLGVNDGVGALPLLGERAGVRADQITNQLPSPIDDSIQVHSCHSPLREMEVLHDHLLDWFNRKQDILPRDIIVMTPDIETYAPFIEAVFGSPEDESRRIPFRIADRGARQSSPVVQTFLGLLRLPQTRLGSATVLALLENHAVRERFALSETDLELARRWIEETRIRWGTDAGHRAALGLPALSGNTWREGFDRLLLGYAMAGDDPAGTSFAGIVPFDDIEGDSTLVLGRVAEFVERLFDTVADLGRSRRLDEWADRLQRVLDDFFLPDEDAERDLQIIRSALHQLRQQHSQSQYNDAVDLGVILEHLGPELEQDRHGAGFLSGGVTFCALKPMRSIPFKVVCLVGMNDAVFPRPNAHLSFDLMARSPRLGDRSTRNDDRYLFLETILSARERLYLSHVGQSIRDNSAIPPSVVVSELLDYVEQGFGLAREQLVTRHRLQAFHESYFQPGGRLFSYSVENCRASQATRRPGVVRAPFISAPLGEPDAEYRQLTLEDLAAFLCNPAAFLLRHRLNIRLRKAGGALDEREPFDLDARDGYALKQQLLEEQLAGVNSADTLKQIAGSGVLPLGQVGRAQNLALTAVVDSFRERLALFNPLRTGPAVDVALILGDFQLSGRITPRTNGGVLNYRVASIKAQDVLRLWIQHLAASATGCGGESILVGTDATHRYRPTETAPPILADLLQLYWRGLRQPLKFFPRSSLAFAGAEHRLAAKPTSKVSPAAEALKQWEGNEFSFVSPESGEPAFELCFGHESPLGDDEFAALARRVFAPVLQHETVEEA